MNIYREPEHIGANAHGVGLWRIGEMTVGESLQLIKLPDGTRITCFEQYRRFYEHDGAQLGMNGNGLSSEAAQINNTQLRRWEGPLSCADRAQQASDFVLTLILRTPPQELQA